MNVFFDHQTFSIQSYGGISRYYTELIDGINQMQGNSAYLSILFSNNIYLNEKNIKTIPFFPTIPFYKKEQILYRVNQINSIIETYTKQYDIFHATYYDTYFIPYLKGYPFIMTIHDMIHEKFSSQFYELAADKVIAGQKRLMANKANAIITVSESTKQDVIKLLNIPDHKIKVIYHGSSLNKISDSATDREFTFKDSYLFFVGRRGHYKNFQGFLKAIHLLLKKHNLKFLCGGGGPFSEEEVLLIQKLGVEKLVKYTPVNDHTLQLLYQNALAFVFPTLYEGFGIPILEAFACSCPCIVSNSSSLPEVAGDAALYIDPLSSESMISAVENLLYSQTLRQKLILKGKNRLLQFSWNKTVHATHELYKSVLQTI